MSDEKWDISKGPTAELDRILTEAETLTGAAVTGVMAEKTVIGRILAPVIRMFQAQATAIWTGFAGAFMWLFEPIRYCVSGDILRPSSEDIKNMTGILGRLGMFDENDLEHIENTIRTIPVISGIFGGLIRLLLFSQFFKTWTNVLGGTAIQNLNKKFSPSVPNPQEIARTSFVAPELHDRVVDAMKRSGLSKEDIELIYVSLYTLQNPGEIMQLFWRGEIDKSQAINKMQELGYTDTRVAELMQLWERIPSMPDVVRYLGKEAFEPAMIKQFGLLGDYPRGETEKWAAANGYSAEWAEKEWIAHWRDVGVAPVLEGLHRHTKVTGYGEVDASYVDDYLRLIEIPGPIREIIAKTSYNVYTRVDARRMHDMGVLADTDLFDVYQAQGYDAEHAANMALFTIRYNQGEGRNFSQKDIEKAYEDGDLDFKTALMLLQEAGFKEDYASFILSLVDVEKERAKRLDATEVIKAKYLSNLVSETDTRNRLLSIGYNNARGSELLDRWTVQKVSNAKLPSKTDLDKMLRHKIINEDNYKVEMSKLGYSEVYISWYLDLAKSGVEG